MSIPRPLSTTTVLLRWALALSMAMTGANAAAGSASSTRRTLADGLVPSDVAAQEAQTAPKLHIPCHHAER